MSKLKKKLTHSHKAAKKKEKNESHQKYSTVFMNGKQVRIKEPEMIEGIPIDEFIRQNADPIFLHQNEMWEYMDNTSD